LLPKFHHIAIVLDRIEEKIAWYCKMYAAERLGDIFIDKNQRVKVQFIKTSNIMIELLGPLGDDSPVSSFLNKHGSGRIYHIAFEVDDLNKMESEIRNKGGVVISRTEDGWQNIEVLFAIFFINNGEEQIIEYIKQK
jgi:methylmalonyl-CoA/ethylmalonyl-CoA epimerase